MFKVYGIYSTKDAFFTETFFIKIDRAITWLKADLKLNGRPYFSDEKMKSFLERSALASKFVKLKEGSSLDIQYGSCSNHYRIIKMTQKEIDTLKEIETKNKELSQLKDSISQRIPKDLTQKLKSLNKELKTLNVQTI